MNTKQNKGKDKSIGDTQREPKTQGWATAAAVLVTAINGGIAFYGWTSAESIKKHETDAATKLAAIQQVLERGYILYARASEREFVDLVANNPGLELTGPAADYAKASVREDRDSLEILENEISQQKHKPTRYLMEAYLALARGDCKDAIINLEQRYPKETPVRYLLLATAYQRCGNVQKSIEQNNKVRELPITRPSERIKAKALNNNGNAFVLNGRLQEAIDYYQAALKADPSLYGVNYNLAAAYSRLGRQEEAMKRLCLYARSHDGNVINEVESDPDKDFDNLRQALGSSWKTRLTARLDSCI